MSDSRPSILRTAIIPFLVGAVMGLLVAIPLTCARRGAASSAVGSIIATSTATSAALADAGAKEVAALKLEVAEAQVHAAASDAKAAALVAEVSRLKAAKPDLLAPSFSPGEKDPCPDLRLLAVKQDATLQAQTVALGDHVKHEASLAAQAAASDGAYQARTEEAKGLRSTVDSLTPVHPWAVGPVIKADFAGRLHWGGMVTRTWKRVEIHGLVVNREALFGATWRFGGSK